MKENDKVYISINAQELKCFMCIKCYNNIKGYYTSSISFFNLDKNLSKDDIKIYSNTDNNVKMLCPYCNDGETEMFEIDEYMIDPIKILNQKGYYTRFCCEGHVYPIYAGNHLKNIKNGTMDVSVPYIWFDWDKIIDKGFKPEIDEDKFFFNYVARHKYTLFKSDYITSKQGLLWPPENWSPDANEIYRYDSATFETFIDSIYYKEPINNLAENLNTPKGDSEEDYTKRFNNALKLQKALSFDNKEYFVKNCLKKWAKDLPNINNIHNEKELIKAFKLDEIY